MKWKYIGLAGISIIGIALCVYGINFGFHVDEPNIVERGLSIAQGHFHQPWYHWPGQSLMFIYAALFKLSSFSVGPLQPYIIARLVSVVATGSTIWCIGLCVYRLTKSTAGSLVASSVYAVSYLVSRNGHFATPDALFTGLLCYILYCAIRAAQEDRHQRLPYWYAVSGLLLGVALATKYTAGLGIVPLVVVYLYYHRRQWRLIMWFFLAVFIGHTIFNPFALLDWKIVLHDIGTEAAPLHLGADWAGQHNFWWNLWSYLTLIPQVIGTAIWVVGIFGGMICVWRGYVKKQIELLLPVIVFMFSVIGLSTLALHWSRWSLPLLPPVTICVGVGVWQLVQWLPKKRLTYVLLSILYMVAIFPPALISVVNSYADMQPSTSALAADWLALHSLPQTTVAGDVEDIVLATPRSYTNAAGQLPSVDQASYDYFVLKADDKTQRFAQPTVYAPEVAWYTQLGNRAKLVTTIAKPKHTILKQDNDLAVYLWLFNTKNWSTLWQVYQGETLQVYKIKKV